MDTKNVSLQNACNTQTLLNMFLLSSSSHISLVLHCDLSLVYASMLQRHFSYGVDPMPLVSTRSSASRDCVALQFTVKPLAGHEWFQKGSCQIPSFSLGPIMNNADWDRAHWFWKTNAVTPKVEAKMLAEMVCLSNHWTSWERLNWPYCFTYWRASSRNFTWAIFQCQRTNLLERVDTTSSQLQRCTSGCCVTTTQRHKQATNLLSVIWQ